MAKKRMFFIIISCLLIIMASTSIVFAWIITQKNTNEIDANTSGIKFVYSVDGEKKLTSSEYLINNLSFFDIDSTYEIDDFLSMACLVTINVKNTGDIDLNYSVSQTSGAVDADNTAGVLCIFSDTLITDVSSYSTINDLISDPNIASGSLEKYSGSNNVDVYVYIIGVQTNDNATNDFLSSAYTFTITIATTSVEKGTA